VVVLGATEQVPAGDVPGGERDTVFDDLGWTARGALFDRRFVVEGLLGRGGMGCVVLARHRELGELRAIKLLRHDRALNQRARARLAREARAAARIRSAHVVRVFDVVVSEEEAAFPYIVMEHLIGETLEARLERGPISVPTVGRIVIEACEALAEAHANGTVHRDLKPSNLFLTSTADRHDFVKVLDFGIAKTDEMRFDLGCTDSHTLLGTPAYASPEQLRASKDVDSRSDIWSLGVIIYECLTGRLPFGDGTLAETSSRILRDEPSPLRQHCRDAPLEIEQLVTRCLDKEREARPPNVRVLVEALAPFAPEAAASCLNYIDGLAPVTEVVTPQPASPRLPAAGAVERATLSQSSFATTIVTAGSNGHDAWGVGGSPAGAHRGRVWEPSEGSHDKDEHRLARSRLRAHPRLAVASSVVAAGVIAALALAGGVRARHEVPMARPAPVPTAVSAPAGPTNASIAPVLSATTTVPVVTHRRSVERRPPAAGRVPRARPPGLPRETVVPVGDLPIDQLIDERK